MHCEFSKAELIVLDLAVMDRGIYANLALESLHHGNDELLKLNIERLNALHKKLSALIEQAEQEVMLPKRTTE